MRPVAIAADLNLNLNTEFEAHNENAIVVGAGCILASRYCNFVDLENLFSQHLTSFSPLHIQIQCRTWEDDLKKQPWNKVLPTEMLERWQTESRRNAEFLWQTPFKSFFILLVVYLFENEGQAWLERT